MTKYPGTPKSTGSAPRSTCSARIVVGTDRRWSSPDGGFATMTSRSTGGGVAVDRLRLVRGTDRGPIPVPGVME